MNGSRLPVAGGRFFGPWRVTIRARRRAVFALIGAAYLSAHLYTLGWFPFVHSDEAWLASLTRTMLLEARLGATEDFFVLTPRAPHALRAFYHLLQMPLVALSFSAYAVRLLSLGAFAVALFGLWKTAWRLYGPVPAWFLTAAAAVDVQLITSAHTARSEMLLVAVMSCAFWYWSAHHPCFVSHSAPDGAIGGAWRTHNSMALGTLLGCAIGIHPNAFVAAAPVVALVLVATPARAGAKAALLYTLASWAALFVAWSLAMNPDFLRTFGEFGASVGVTDSPLRRWFNLRDMAVKLYRRISGTYYIPPVRVQLVVFALATLAGVGTYLARRARSFGAARAARSPALPNAPSAAGAAVATQTAMVAVVAVAAVVAAEYIVGKFSPPSAVFLWMPAYLLVGALVAMFLQRRDNASTASIVAAGLVGVGLIAALALTTVAEVRAHRSRSYDDYLAAIDYHVPSDAVVLANLNSAFAFDPGVLRTYRDLASLPASGGGIAAFLRREGVQYVIYPDEMDLIYAERPVWNILYGNVFPYYEDLQRFLSTECDPVAVVHAPEYAMRIVSRMDGTHRARIYRVRPPAALP